MRGRDGPPDKRLFRRARQGDRQAFLLLLRRYDPRLRRLVLRLVAEPERVDAILRRAYVKAWRSLPMVELPGSVAEWLYRVVYNACVNELRWAPERPPPEPVQGPRVPLPVASAERRLAGLRALTPEERIPLALVDGEGFNLEATARILQRPPVAVAADLSRARGRWRSFVVGDGRPGHDAPEVVELDEPDAAAVEAEAESDDLAPGDQEPTEGASTQPRHVRVVTPTEGNGHDPSASVAPTEDDLGGDPSTSVSAAEDDLGGEPSTSVSATADDLTHVRPTSVSPTEDLGHVASASVGPMGDGSGQEPSTDDVAPAAATGSAPSSEEPPAEEGADSEVAAGDEQLSQPAAEATQVTPPADEGEPAPKGARKNGETASDRSEPASAGEGDEAPSSTGDSGRSAAGATAAGAGTRRKRRRNAKRDVSARAAQSATSKSAGQDVAKPDGDGDASARRDESHEAT